MNWRVVDNRRMNLIRYFLVLVLVGAFVVALLSYRFILQAKIATVTLNNPVQLPRYRFSVESTLPTLNYDAIALPHNTTATPRHLGGFTTSLQGSTEVSTQASIKCTWWKTSTTSPYFLTAVLLVRIYYTDLAGLTSREMLQWLHYLKYAGVEHLYVYDAYVFGNESQSRILAPYVQEGYVTYVDWSHRASPYSIDGTQLTAYQDCITRWGKVSVWQTAIDIDEYPFSPKDQKPGFMTRFIKSFAKQHPEVSEITMQNYLFLGKPLNDKEQPFLFGRLWRRTRKPGNYLVKPVYKPAHVISAQVHHNALGQGQTLDAPDEQFRMNHYWGARLQNWGEDTAEIINITEEDRSMETILREITSCFKNKDDLYTKRWN